ncbi:MAG TPA: glutamate synthase large subunit [Spirochaetota bacterium]|nr:glutamate synthase large subunit [Spirochaetota bacterium]
MNNIGLYKNEYEHDSCGIGFVAHIQGCKSHDIVSRGLEVLCRMEHRGAEGADNKTGDGSGIMLQVPREFFATVMNGLPENGAYAVGMTFLPSNTSDADACRSHVEDVLNEEGLEFLGWREVPVNNSDIGIIAKESEPRVSQFFVAQNIENQEDFERKLYIVRKTIERRVRESSLVQKKSFYIPSLSGRTIVYKGMLTPSQVGNYYTDLQNAEMKSAIALVHSRFSTNTFPSWDLAQPFRMLAHNGEINTVKGNRFWMQSRESNFKSGLFGNEIRKILPVIEPGKSDSASFDNALELLVMAGRSMPHSLMMLIPESWNEKNPIPENLKYFYEYHSTIMEPWDGPASMVFCDGRYVGGTLDRNGLRPSRYVVTSDNLIVMGSEVGVQTFPPEKVIYKGRLMPGKLLLVDTAEGRIIPDAEIKDRIAGSRPYREWVETHRINLGDTADHGQGNPVALPEKDLHTLNLVFGYSREDLETIISPMVLEGKEPTGSMGTDTPLAVFSDKPQPMFNYFKQVFAQVTNPPIDPIREELVMTLTSYIGCQGNLLDESPEHCRMLKYRNPVMTNSDIEKIRKLDNPHFRVATIPMVFRAAEGPEGLRTAVEQLCIEAETKIEDDYNFIILSDRNQGPGYAPIPSLMACGAVHHHLIRKKMRSRVGLILETGEAREVMHFALLFSYGAGAVNPYGAFANIFGLYRETFKKDVLKYYNAKENYIKALNMGLLKVISKMGISTLRSYRGAQVFEAIGLGKDIIDTCFTGTESRIGGIGFREAAEEVLARYRTAYETRPGLLDSSGVYQYRKYGERHAWNPESIYLLQNAARTGSYEKYREFASLVNEQNRKPHVIRGLFDFRKQSPVPLEDVEPASEIVKRFVTGAMSFGSLSIEAHEALAAAMNRIGGKSNSGEGGEKSERYLPQADGTMLRSAIKQVASGRFGVTSNYLANADEIQIKMAQGAKPGEGGQLPGFKVDKVIAGTRHSTPGVTLISPPPHHDIYSIEDLAQLIFDLKNANPAARISVKLVSESGIGTIAAGVAKAHADNITISGYDGGTGASPISSIKHAGLPWELGLAETNQTLVLNGLRGRVRIQTDGQLKTGRDVVIAALLGAEEFAFGTASLIVLGCIMMRKCHKNTCPVGVATQDPELRKRFAGKPEHLINYFTFIAEEAREIMAELGVTKFDDLVGRSDMLEPRAVDHWKARTVDTGPILVLPEPLFGTSRRCTEQQVHKIDDVIDRWLIEQSFPAIAGSRKADLEAEISNTDRAVGAMLSWEISRRYGDSGLPDNSINCTFRGSAGQSFGAFLQRGVTFRLEGDANDYFGKGLSGGRLIAVPPAGSPFKPEENIIIGNTVLYGATSGEAFIRGIAGERFCVRNSGVEAVVEGTGDHCAEYMTGGRIVVLGRVGRNFGAGMSGGIAYVLNIEGDFEYYCNKGMVELSPLQEYDDQEYVKKMLTKHAAFTGSTIAGEILENWHRYMTRFIRVMPFEYKRALQEKKLEQIEKELREIREEEQLEVISDG